MATQVLYENGCFIDTRTGIGLSLDSEIWRLPPKQFLDALTSLRLLYLYHRDVEILEEFTRLNKDQQRPTVHQLAWHFEYHNSHILGAFSRIAHNTVVSYELKQKALKYLAWYLAVRCAQKHETIYWNKCKGKYPRRIPPWMRKEVIERDKSSCRYCGTEVSGRRLTVDHIIPYIHGGKTIVENLVVACRKCNTRKWAYSLAEANERFGMTLIGDSP